MASSSASVTRRAVIEDRHWLLYHPDHASTLTDMIVKQQQQQQQQQQCNKDNNNNDNRDAGGLSPPPLSSSPTFLSSVLHRTVAGHHHRQATMIMECRSTVRTALRAARPEGNLLECLGKSGFSVLILKKFIISHSEGKEKENEEKTSSTSKKEDFYSEFYSCMRLREQSYLRRKRRYPSINNDMHQEEEEDKNPSQLLYIENCTTTEDSFFATVPKLTDFDFGIIVDGRLIRGLKLTSPYSFVTDGTVHCEIDRWRVVTSIQQLLPFGNSLSSLSGLFGLKLKVECEKTDLSTVRSGELCSMPWKKFDANAISKELVWLQGGVFSLELRCLDTPASVDDTGLSPNNMDLNSSTAALTKKDEKKKKKKSEEHQQETISSSFSTTLEQGDVQQQQQGGGAVTYIRIRELEPSRNSLETVFEIEIHVNLRAAVQHGPQSQCQSASRHQGKKGREVQEGNSHNRSNEKNLISGTKGEKKSNTCMYATRHAPADCAPSCSVIRTTVRWCELAVGPAGLVLADSSFSSEEMMEGSDQPQQQHQHWLSERSSVRNFLQTPVQSYRFMI